MQYHARHDIYCSFAMLECVTNCFDSMTMLGMVANAVCKIMLGMVVATDFLCWNVTQLVVFPILLDMLATVMCNILLGMLATAGLLHYLAMHGANAMCITM